MLFAASTVLVMLMPLTSNAQRKGKWVTLFDGSSTAGWRGYKSESFPTEGWKIEDGALVTVVGARHTDIITKEKYADFELEAEWRVTPGGNGGIFYFVTENYPNAYDTGPEMQVLDDALHRDGLNPLTSAGALYGLIAPVGKTLKPVGEFNRARVIVFNNHVEHYLNGKKIVQYDLGSDQLKSLIAASKFKDMPGFMQHRSGHVALQHHGEAVAYRKVRVRTLSAN
jgi:hypothetical protein